MVQISWRLTRRKLLWIAPLAVVFSVVGLFCVNGLLLARGETPLVVQTEVPPLAELAPLRERYETGYGPDIKIMAFNIAKGFVHQGGFSFATIEEMNARVGQIAALIKAERPDLVFLSEAILECGPTPVNQVEQIAEQSGMSSWAFGENFSFGFPGYRIVSGNAILAKSALTPAGNLSLAGRQPFYITKNNRRALFCRTTITGRSVLLVSIHTDSFDIENNLAQTHQILDFCAGEPTILAGDFNCEPHEPSIPLVMASAKFTGSTANTLTFPAVQPVERLDYIFAPADWELVEERIIPGTVSDHRAVVARFVIPW